MNTHALLDMFLQKTPTVAVMHITPDMARGILAHNDNNRNLSYNKVEQISSDLVAGRWAFNGESVVIAKDGSLNDGQHRLAAVVATGVGIDTVVACGVTRESRFTVDQGLARSTSAILGLNGVK